MIIAGHSRAAGRLLVDWVLPQGSSVAFVKHGQGGSWLGTLERSTQTSSCRARGSATGQKNPGGGRAMVGPSLKHSCRSKVQRCTTSTLQGLPERCMISTMGPVKLRMCFDVQLMLCQGWPGLPRSGSNHLVQLTRLLSDLAVFATAPFRHVT